MASIEKRISQRTGKITYKAIVQAPNQPRQTKTFKRKTDAVDWAKLLEHDLKVRPHLADIRTNKHTLKEAIGRYSKNELLALSTKDQQNRRTLHLQWWLEQLGNRPLVAIQPKQIAECIAELSTRQIKKINERTGKEEWHAIKQSTVYDYRASLSALYGVAIKQWHWVDTNPVQQTARPKFNNERTRYLREEPETGHTDSEYSRLIRAVAESESPNLMLAVEIALHSGARKNEVLSLVWEDIDFDSGIVSIGLREDAKTKTRDKRRIPLPEHVIDQLQTRKDENRRPDTNLIFPSTPKPGNPVKPIDLKNPWTNAKKRAEVFDFHFHDLRHSGASMLAMEGASLLEIAAVLGHKTLAMVKRYSHLSPDHVATTASRIGERIARKQGGQ